MLQQFASSFKLIKFVYCVVPFCSLLDPDHFAVQFTKCPTVLIYPSDPKPVASLHEADGMTASSGICQIIFSVRVATVTRLSTYLFLHLFVC